MYEFGRRLLRFKACFFLFLCLMCVAAKAGQKQPKLPPITASGSVDMKLLLRGGPFKDLVEGKESAPVTIVEYASVSCAHCADFYVNVLPKIEKKHIKTGKVRYIFREFPYDPRATAAFMLARCLPKERYTAFLKVLYQKMDDWAFSEDGETALENIARLAGMSEHSFNACLKNEKLLHAVNEETNLGAALNITATPTFFINGLKYVGAFTEQEISTIIETELKKNAKGIMSKKIHSRK